VTVSGNRDIFNYWSECNRSYSTVNPSTFLSLLGTSFGADVSTFGWSIFGEHDLDDNAYPGKLTVASIEWHR